MHALVIGSGGREHSIVKSFAESVLIEQIFVSPGNAGTDEIAVNVIIDLKNHEAVVQFCKLQNIGLVFIGPEDPLVDGLCDSLRAADILVVGPSKKAAQLEGSKIFAKKFMEAAGVPTAKADIVNSVESTMAAAKNYTAPYILKADGLAAGKGVFICRTLEILESAAKKIFVEKTLGAAGETALLEQNLPGTEISFLVLTNGETFQALPLAQDHKRLLNKNLGPNTGGMGTVAPMDIPHYLYHKIIEKVIQPSVDQLKKENYLFYGILFVGLMIVDNEPYVLEYNVRLGDPETQVILPLIKNDIGKVFHDLAQGQLEELSFTNKKSICIVNAAAGYPGNPVKDTPIHLPIGFQPDVYILHAGTKLDANGYIRSNGGRVLNVIAIDETFEKAKNKALELNAKINFEGRQYRTDIGNYQSKRQDT
ncbi:MAG: phosphoribosylamine--glycine ligase [Bdellovibrio sp.]|nr:phosphoribosylamine--glycine ligase [Bdellovibrio sp.]